MFALQQPLQEIHSGFADQVGVLNDRCVAAQGATNVGGPTPYWTSWTLDTIGLRKTQTHHAIGGGTSRDKATGTVTGTRYYSHNGTAGDAGYSAEDLAYVAGHLGRLDHSPANDAMIGGIQQTMAR